MLECIVSGGLVWRTRSVLECLVSEVTGVENQVSACVSCQWWTGVENQVSACVYCQWWTGVENQVSACVSCQ